MLHVALGVVIGRERAEGIVNDAAGLLPSSVGWRGTGLVYSWQICGPCEAPSWKRIQNLDR